MAAGAATSFDADQDDPKQPTTALDLDGSLVRFKRWFKEDKDHCEKWHGTAREDYDFAALRQWAEKDKEALEAEGRVALTFDRTGVIIDSVTGAEVANRQEVRYIPRSKGDAIQDEILTEGARWFRDQCNAEHEESHAFRDVVISGMGWTETRLDYEENPDGDPKIERIDPLCMYWDHAARKPNLTDSRRFWRVFPDMPIEEARAKFPGTPEAPIDDEDLDASWARSENKDSNPYDASRPRYRYPKPMGDDDDGEAEIVTLVEVQWVEREPFYRGTVIKPPPPMPPDPAVMPGSQAPGMPAQMMPPPLPAPPPQPSVERIELSEAEHQAMLVRAPQMGWQYRALKQMRKVHYKAFVGGKVLEAGKLFAPPQGSSYPVKGHCRGFAYNCITGKLDRNLGHFFGLMRPMKDPQRYTNKWLSQALHIMNTTAKGGIMAERTAFEDAQDAEDNWARNDKITYLKPGGKEKIYEKPIGGFPAQIMQMAEFAISSVRDATGVNAEVLGLRSADQAASLEYQRRQAATTILAPLFDSLKLYRRRQGEVLLYLIVNYLADGRLIRITSDDAAQGQYAPFQIADDAVTYDVIVDDAPTSPNQKEAMWSTVTQIMPFLKGLPVPPEVYMILLECSPLPASAVSEIKQAMGKAQAAAAQQQQAPQEQPPPPDPANEAQAAKTQIEAQFLPAILTAKARAANAEADRKQAGVFTEHARGMSLIAKAARPPNYPPTYTG